jgi:hypothetical protein
MKRGALIIFAMLVLAVSDITVERMDKMYNSREARIDTESGIAQAALGISGARAEAAQGHAISLWSSAVGQADRVKKCLNGSPFYGCCSSHDGVREITDANTVICNDSEEISFRSSCTTNFRGCCSGHDGVDHVRKDGRVVCGDTALSDTCACERVKE